MTLPDIKSILPNARIVEFLDCHVVVDRNGKEIGYFDEGFYLKRDYEHAQGVYNRFAGEGKIIEKFYK